MTSLANSSGYGTGTSRSRPVLNKQAVSLYNHNLKTNEAKYSNDYQGAYAQGQQTLKAGIDRSLGMYADTTNKAIGMLGFNDPSHPFGVATPAAAQIQQSAANDYGRIQSQMMNSGMGNSTVMAGMLGASRLNANQALAGLGANMAQTAAGYEMQGGLAGAGASMQGLGMQATMADDYMGGIHNFLTPNLTGSITGEASNSQSQQQSQSTSQSTNPMGSGGGMPGMPGMDTGNGQGGAGYDPNAGIYGGLGGDPGQTVTHGANYGAGGGGGPSLWNPDQSALSAYMGGGGGAAVAADAVGMYSGR